MRTKTFLFATYLSILVLVCVISFAFTACSSDDYNTSIDEFLSEDTTPITFEIPKGVTVLFDYAGSHLVKSDTFELTKSGNVTVELQQGKHNLIWINGLDKQWSNKEDTIIYDSGSWFVNSRINYNPNTMLVLDNGGDIYSRSVSFSQKEMDITQYLMATQKTTYTPLTGNITIEITDQPQLDENVIVRIYEIPFIKSVGVVKDTYASNEWSSFRIHYSTKYKSEQSISAEIKSLCPPNGIHNIQLKTEIIKDNGDKIPATPLPKFSIRRSYNTHLKGPIFSGSVSDWTVTMEPYN